MSWCIFYTEEQDGNATIKDCKLRSDGNAYPSHAPKCNSCKYFTTAAMAKKMLDYYVYIAKHIVHCKECEYWVPPQGPFDELFGSPKVGSYCGRFEDVTVCGYRDGEISYDKTKAWFSDYGFCSNGKRKDDV